MALAERAELTARLDLEGNFAAKLKSSGTALGKFQAGVGRAGKGIGQVGAGMAKAGAILGGAVAAGLIAATKAGADLEAQLNTINTIARADAAGLQKIGDQVRMIARDTGTPLEELTQGYYDLLSAGIKTADAQNVLTQANKLAIGGLASTAETVDLLTTAINVYGGDAKKAAEFADDFATAIERGKVTAAELAGSYANVAPLARSLNIENAELAAGYARLTASGTPAAEAATQMASAMTALLKTTPGLEALQKQTGRNYAAIAGKKGLNVGLQQMRDDAEKAGIKLIDLVGRKEALLYILQTTGPNLEAYNKDLAAMGDNAGTAAEQMSERQKGLAFQVGRLKANLKDAGIELAAGFLPALTRSADKLSTFLNTDANRSALKAIGEDIGKSIDGIDWGKVLDGAKVFVEVMKGALGFAAGLLQTVNLLPTEIKAAGLGLLGLNKLSGGMLGQGIGNIVGGLASAVGGAFIKAGIGKAFVQPVFVTNMGAGGMGGAGAAGGKGGGLIAGAGAAVAGAVVVQGVFDAGTIVNGIDRVVKANNMDDITSAVRDVRDGVMLFPPGVQGLMDVLLNQVPPKITEPFDAAAFRLGEKMDLSKQTTVNALNQVREKAEANRIATVTSQRAIVSSGNSDRNAIVTAIQRNRPVVRVTVNTRVSVNSITKAAKTQSAYGGGQIGTGANEYG